ncbi:DUF1566 domain-containing protein [uncultured Bacteroides sp.]|uniref:fimbrial tip adhesin FimD n=1 Tax=uncultured Bacteroides sp. TaxID=162156 RepID=UPI0026223D34|nr:DUF1566 domain-containing protein [uncultured Bacteroides sp.]
MKRRNIIYIVVCVLFCFVCLACSDETENAFAPTETGLILQINVGQNTFTRADGTTNSSAESAWDNVIHYLDVFIFDSTTGDLVPNCYFHFGDGTNNIVDPVCLISGNWKNRFQDYETCDVYVVANLHIHSSGDNTASETLKDIENLSELQQLTDEYQNIYQPVSPDSKKPFTMSGYRMGWEPAASSNVYTIPVELTRLAAKIEISLDLKFEDAETEISGKEYIYPTNDDIGQLQYSVHNYATNALVLPGNDDTFEYDVASSAGINIKFVDKDDEGKSVPKIIAYTYPTEWTNDILKETYIIFNAQLKAIDETEYMNNYYKIPLRLSNDENKMLERNHWYKVKATIYEKGNATPDKPVEIADVHYEVAPWNDIDIDINGDTPMYLELSEYDVVMRNVDTYDLTFASSSQIAKPENENEKADINIKEIYYYNKNGKKINITDPEILNNTYLSVDGSLNGNLVIHSPIPENKTIRYITLTVKNTQYKEGDSGTNSCIKTVTIKQYPLEYITGIAGLYSYLENDNRYTNAWPTNLTTIGNIKIDQRIRVGLNKHIGKSVDMKSKFYLENGENSKIYRIDYSYDSKDNYLVDNGTASNNQMYHVVITSTSNRYKLARPPMTSDAEDATVVQNSINNEFVSPSFMLASQLGNSSVISWDEAQTQCQHYVEVGNNDIKYNDWRLPTLEEIKIIKQYQEAVPDVMDAVLETREKNEDGKAANPYYWTAIKDVYHYTGNATDETDGKRTECRVRCVRDFHVGEPTE